jgi:hypothetical protein
MDERLRSSPLLVESLNVPRLPTSGESLNVPRLPTSGESLNVPRLPTSGESLNVPRPFWVESLNVPLVEHSVPRPLYSGEPNPEELRKEFLGALSRLVPQGEEQNLHKFC